MVKDVENALTDLNIQKDFNTGPRYIHFCIIHFLGRKATKGPLWTNWCCLESPAREESLWVQPFQHSCRKLSTRFPLLSASDLDSVGTFLLLDGGTSEGPQGSTKRDLSTACLKAMEETGGAHLF